MSTVEYDEFGQNISGSLASYLLATAHELPDFELLPMHTPNQSTPAGLKGMAEGGVMGAIGAVTNAINDALAPFGVVVERQSYDAWGRRRTVTHNAGTWTVTYPATPGSAETHRGFTGHEMLDLVGLVHMGGRVYDPITARFLSPDPFVQSPDNLQNLNRYSYVLNNPLSYTDPSGFFFKGIGKWLSKNWKTIVTVAVAVVAAVYAPGLLGLHGFWGAVAGGAASARQLGAGRAGSGAGCPTLAPAPWRYGGAGGPANPLAPAQRR